MGLAQTRHQMAGTQLDHTSSPAACQLFFTEMLGQRVTSHWYSLQQPSVGEEDAGWHLFWIPFLPTRQWHLQLSANWSRHHICS